MVCWPQCLPYDIFKMTMNNANCRAWKRSGTLSFILLWLILGFSVAAQERPQKIPQQKEVHNVTVNAITIAVTVQDKKGRFINDLGEKDFIVYENGERKAINYFQHDRSAPLSLTVLLDVSGSMAIENKFEECRRALHVLAENILAPQDELALLVFADGEVEVAVRHSQDRSAFLAALDREKAYGKTALNDAVAVSPQYAVRARNEKRALVLITDGIENDSQSSAGQALEIARRVDVPIYVIGYKIPRAEEILARHKRRSGLTSMGIVETLSLFAGATGGKAFFLDDLESLLSTLYEIKSELSHQYLIGYTSYKEDDKYRRIMVTTPGGNYRIRTRQGY